MKVRNLLPRRIASQVAVLLVASTALVYLIMTGALYMIAREPREAPRMAGEFVTAVRMLDAATGANERTMVTEIIQRAFPNVTVGANRPPAAKNRSPKNRSVSLVRRELGPDYRVLAEPLPPHDGEPPATKIAVALSDGTLVSATLPSAERRFLSPLTPPVLATLLFIGISVGLLSLWAMRALTAPLAAFANAAAAFGLRSDHAALSENGPEEVRKAARAFNLMRDRIKRLMEERTAMLAAVGHDLRTPITRLRLRAEFIEDEAVREQMLRDLEQLNGLVQSALSFLRDGQTPDTRTTVDVAALLQTVCDEFGDLGNKVRYEGPNHLPAKLRPDDLSRAVSNLVGNAVRFGTEVAVKLNATDRAILIDVEDNGPGIPDCDKDKMVQPFVRGDAARNMNSKDGFGLGLAITRLVAEAHGGQLSLLNRAPSGLVARIELPVT
jgi:signal transduction histidine kinase